MTADDLPFRQLGHFRIVGLIGRGRTGAVYVGYDESLDRHVAVKVLSDRLAQSAACVREFHEAATATARITHPNVVRIHYIGEDGGRQYVATDLVEGESLADRLAEGAPLPPDEALAIVGQCLAGLQAAHARGLVHENVTPGNVLIERDTGRVVLTDFGRIAAASAPPTTSAADATGTAAACVAPEQAQGVAPDPRADLYALGIILHQMLWASLPGEAGSARPSGGDAAHPEPPLPGNAFPDVPEPVSAFVARLIDEDPSRRYPDAAAASSALAAIRQARTGGRAASLRTRAPERILRTPDPVAESTPAPAGLDRPDRSSPWHRFRESLLTILRRDALRKRMRRDRMLLALLAAAATGLVLAWMLWPHNRHESPTAAGATPAAPERATARPARPTGVPAPAREPAAVPLDGLILYLTFEPETVERVGQHVVVKDLSGRGNHGLVYGPRWSDQGRVGRCAEFDGKGDYIRFPTLLNTEIEENEAFTLSLWVQDTAYKEGAYIFDGVYPPDKGPRLSRHAQGRAFRFVGPLSVTECSAGGLGSQIWHHVAGVWDRSGTLLYVDGKLVGRAPGRPDRRRRAPREPEATVIVGCQSEQSSETYYAGLIDELLVFNRALAAGEVQALYRMGLAGTRPPPPVADPPLGDVLPREVLDQETLSAHQQDIERMRSGRIARWGGFEPTTMAVMSDGDHAFISCSNGWTFLRDLVNEQELGRERAQPVMTPTHRLVLRKDDTCWAACGASDVIYVAHVKQVHQRATLRTSMQEVFDIAFSPDGRRLLAGGVPGPGDSPSAPLALWDVEDRKLVREFPLPTREVTAVAYSPDAAHALAACGDDHAIRLVALDDGREAAALVGHAARVNRLAFLPNGRRALSASDDGTVRLWDLESGSQVRQLEGHIKPVCCLDISSDGRYVLSGGLDGLCCIWEVESGELVWYTLPGAAEVASARFNQDSRFVAVLTRDWSLYQWRVPTVVDKAAAEVEGAAGPAEEGQKKRP